MLTAAPVEGVRILRTRFEEGFGSYPSLRWHLGHPHLAGLKAALWIVSDEGQRDERRLFKRARLDPLTSRGQSHVL